MAEASPQPFGSSVRTDTVERIVRRCLDRIAGSPVRVAESGVATPRSIPNRVVPHTSAGEYCAGNRVGGEAAARTAEPTVHHSAPSPRGGAAAARWAHNPEVVGSNPTPATSEEPSGLSPRVLFSSTRELLSTT